MTKKSSKSGVIGCNGQTSAASQLTQQLSAEEQQTLHQELKSAGAIDNPIKYTETHLKGGIEHED